ncbi:ATP-binding protein [Streptomyces nigrescens]|uniref:ATP-binding protein n=2 Tax=Streptomyces TaxID=1883 RepID=A0ABM7ZXP2_STRNI|nr:ATP-binding protein [Streptomyces nigrescens]MEE4425097.1 ATP-binding protein [Streptomyces sp. DSM 41528]BDM71147.1 ATP-binding protein [Streptomyces nigrescens]
MPAPDGFAACALSSSAQTVAEARRFTRSTLTGWRLAADVTENAALVVTELVSNALRHGLRTGEPDAAPVARGFCVVPAPVCPAWLALTRQETAVLCAVSDAGTDAPVVRTPDPLAESGRGLHLVDRLSDAWGWTPPDHSGKTVWATVSLRG